jgi:Protein of unknown function (DUF3455)
MIARSFSRRVGTAGFLFFLAKGLLWLAAPVLVAVWRLQPACADGGHVTPPPVPANIEVPEGNRAYLEGHAVGTQNYICLASGSAFAWTLFTPQATLFDDRDRQVTTHFFSPNPIESGTVRPTWQHSRDTSSVWAQLVPGATSSDPIFVAPGAIPWLLLEIVGAQDGPAGGHHGRSRGGVLRSTTFIHRVNTAGGMAPSAGCSLSTDVGKKAFVPYEADYFFYQAEHERDARDDS